MIYGFKSTDDGVQILMSFIDGRSISTIELHNNNPAAASIKEACLKALQNLHNRGIAHLDAHPGNFMLKYDGDAIAIDMGFSHEANIFTITFDYFYFTNKFLNNSGKELFNLLTKTYVDYISKNKIKTLIYGSLSITTIYYLTISAISRKLFGMMTKYSLENQGINLYYTLLHYKRIYLVLEERRGSQSLLTTFIAKSNKLCAGIELIFSAYLINKIYNCSDSILNVKNKISRALNRELSYEELDSQLLIDTAKIALTLIYDITRLYYVANQFNEAYMKPTESKLATCTTVANTPKSMLNYFGLSSCRATIITADVSSATTSSIRLSYR